MASTDCLFCNIIAGSIPAHKVYEDDHAVVFHDINPQAPVHYLAIPREHFSNIHDVPPEKAMILGSLFSAVKTVVDKENLAEKGYRLVINSGKSAGQAVFHIHVHILSGRTLTWPPG